MRNFREMGARGNDAGGDCREIRWRCLRSIHRAWDQVMVCPTRGDSSGRYSATRTLLAITSLTTVRFPAIPEPYAEERQPNTRNLTLQVSLQQHNGTFWTIAVLNASQVHRHSASPPHVNPGAMPGFFLRQNREITTCVFIAVWNP